MRVRIKFDKGILSGYRKVWCDVPETCKLTKEFVEHVKGLFGLETEIELVMHGYVVPPMLDFVSFAEETDVIEAKVLKGVSTEKPSEFKKLQKPKEPQKPKELSSSDTEPQKPKEPNSFDTESSEEPLKKPRVTQSKNLRKKNKKNPKIVPFTGKRVVFNEEPKPNKHWLLENEGSKKTFVKRFGEFEPSQVIKEVYHIDFQDYQPTSPESLKPNDEIIFKTLELNEETLTPQVSDFKKGKVTRLDQDKVEIKLLREVPPEEEEMLQALEVIDDTIKDKYQLTLEKKWLTELHSKVINNGS